MLKAREVVSRLMTRVYLLGATRLLADSTPRGAVADVMLRRV